MSVIELMKLRRSVRSYTGEPLSREHLEAIKNYIATLKAPFGADARIELIHTQADTGRIKLGTYGYIKGASDFITLSYTHSPLAEEGAAYLFEQVILFCTGLGLGTCWLGGSFSRKAFKGQISLKPNEKLRIVSPVGYPSDKKHLIEKLMGAEGNHKSRKPFGSFFYNKNFSTPLTEEAAGIYKTPLEMVRIAPSANNVQPWRILSDGNTLHFFRCPPAIGNFSPTDIGIALCHFEQSCIELKINGELKAVDVPIHIVLPKKFLYTISWDSNDM